MRLVVGLGNPGQEYQNTRHNIGFMVIDSYANANNLSFRMKKDFKGEIYIDKDFCLLKPTTYMNLSGESVRSVASFYKIKPEDILIVSDDFNIPFLKLRLREKGSAGGHNGLKSIIQELGSQEFNRLRVGLGSPEINTINFVLSRFSKEETKKIEEIYTKTNEIIKEFVLGKPFDLIMNRFNINESIQKTPSETGQN